MSEATVSGPSLRRRRGIARWSPGGAVGLTLLALVAGQLVALATLLAGGEGASWVDGAGLVAADLVTLGIIVLAARRGADHLGAATFGLRRTDATAALGWTLLAYVGYISFSGVWSVIVGGGGGSEGGATSAGDVAPIVVALLFLGVAVTAPIVEEIVFRGYLFAALTRWRGPWPAAAISGLLFGAAHLLVYPPLAVLPLAVMGFFLAFVFWSSGSLLPCIALHAANNALVLAVSLDWSWQVPLAVVGVPALALLVLAPLARERAPQAAG
jgi:uncharacterized protein